MRSRHWLLGWGLVSLVVVSACYRRRPAGRSSAPDAGPDAAGVGEDGGGLDAGAGADAGADAAPDAGPVVDPSDAVFAQDVLHEIDLEIDPALFDELDLDHDNRVPANVTVDGMRLENAGIREKCGIGSCTTILDKAAFSIRFDQFVPDQELLGLRRLVLNNSIQDPSYSNELLGQELARRAGIPYKRVAHARVTLNGDPYGLFVMVEAVDKRFLRRHFGAGQDEGNLYEGPCCGDFVLDPHLPELKDEDEGRTRDDLVALARFIGGEPDETFVGGLDDRVDLPGYLTGYAIAALTYHWDGYEYNVNNYYAYHRPSDGRFVFWLHGMDQLFYDCSWPIFATPRGRLGQRVLENAPLVEGYRAEVQRVLDDAWAGGDPDLLDFLDAVRPVFEDAARADPRHPLDEWRLRTVRTCLIDRPDIVRAQLRAVCGDGALQDGEGCDDGNALGRDGCSPTCQSECGNGQVDGDEGCDDGNPWGGDGCSESCQREPACGDGVVHPKLLEECDDGQNGDNRQDGCRDDCTINRCGDGRLDAGETCDDGGTLDGDGCDAACADEDGVATCGNGLLEDGEQCDDGDVQGGDACEAGCVRRCTGGDDGLVWGANQHCYRIVWAGVDWASAQEACAALAGHLATAANAGEDQLLGALGIGWLGLTDQETEGELAWITGEPVLYQGFAPGEPNDWGGNEDCVHVNWGGPWNDLDCASAMPFFCEIE